MNAMAKYCRRFCERKRPALLACLPLLLALSTVFIFGHDLRSHLERDRDHSRPTYKKMAISANLSLDHHFLMFWRQELKADGTLFFLQRNRFPIGGHVLIALAIMPFGDDLTAQLYAARTLMLLCFAATALLAYLSLCRLTRQPWIAATATLMAFSSFYCLFHSDMVHNETGIDLLGTMLTFHGMVLFVQEGRFRQLIVKTCIAVLLGWHVYALLLPFVTLGLVRECRRARSVPFNQKVALLIRSRYMLLGLVALLVGLAVLTFNFANEYVALKGEKSLTELPSFQSMMRRTGVEPDVPLDWGFFLLNQFSRIGGMSTPYFLLPYFGVLRPSTSYGPLLIGAGIGVGIGVFVTCLFGVYHARHRLLWATLAMFGFCWALPMRHNVKSLAHAFESVFYIGLPLVFFSLILLGISQRFRSPPPLRAGSVGVALIAFVLSSFQMSHLYDPDATQRLKVVLSEFTDIRRLTADGPPPIFVPFTTSPDFMWAEMTYYLNRRIISSHSLTADGFTIMPDRLDTDALLTPQNERIFLYDSKGLLEMYRQAYQRAESGELVTRSTFDVYRDESALYYVKTPCSDKDMKTRFSLHIFRTDAREFSTHRRLFGYDSHNFQFRDHGLRFDEKCLARIALPQDDIAHIETGPLPHQSYDSNSLKVYRQSYQSVVAGEPVARSTFDVYRDERALYYVKNPCADEDVKLPFFLHIFPTDVKGLPHHRRWLGYDNYDFHFSHGVQFDDKCMASIALPQYDIARIKTGQHTVYGTNHQAVFSRRTWEAKISFNELSK